ncbi:MULTISPECIES: hypothetical protein [Microcoleus]|uniref:Uncharacterized protein n=2 Tax=Microcoleus TaxID=44471 RepID=A0ABU8YRG4_9CYAN
MTYIKSSLHRPVLNSIFSSFAYFAPSRLNHSDTTGIDIRQDVELNIIIDIGLNTEIGKGDRHDDNDSD